MTTIHPDYDTLSAHTAILNLHHQTKNAFSDVIEDLYNHFDSLTKQPYPLVSELIRNIVVENADRLNSAIVYDRDFNYTYSGFKTLELSCLLKINDKVVERPQHMLMRVAIGIHGEDIDSAIETYNLMSEKWFIHATPTLLNAGTNKPQLSSSLLNMKEDSIEGIFDTIRQCGTISKHAGDIGLSVHCIRANGSKIVGTNGQSNGLLQMLRVFNNTARYVQQGANKKPGSLAIYLEPWHADFFDFLNAKMNTGKEEMRARDLFYALWIPDLFMKRVEADAYWTLMCPNSCPGLDDVWGDEFEKLYEKYESEGRGKKIIKAQELWAAIIESQIETGTPYMLYKDHANRKSNQQNLGTIKSSNLSTEIIEYTSNDEIAVSNSASISLNRFVKEDKTFDFKKLIYITGIITRNLNRIIDVNNYPLEECRKSNMRHRPISIGVQGFADTFMLMRYPFESEEAQKLNRDIFEAIYYGALKASCELAKIHGPYETYEGSPISKGILQFDMWNVEPSGKFDFDSLREEIKKYGVRNSLLVAAMPTLLTAQILENSESFEPLKSNLNLKSVSENDYEVINPYLLKDLTDNDLWSDELRQEIKKHNGSIQKIDCIPDNLKKLYKTTWEIPQKVIINMAADRGPFIDQSQSLNIHMAEPTYGKMSSMHFYAWKKGLKTGMFNLRYLIEENIENTKTNGINEKELIEEMKLACSLQNREACLMCSS